MPELAPLRGLHYNPEKVPNLREIVTPPYDVISPAQQAVFYARHPYNMIRLILPRAMPADSPGDNCYTRAAADFAAWQRDQVLIRQSVPALYYWETTFRYEDKLLTRCGLVGLLRLEPFERGIVRPHEKTFSATKNDRFQLMRHCQANLSPIFALYPDRSDQVLATLRTGVPDTPLYNFDFPDGFQQRFFQVTDSQVVRATCQLMYGLPIYIADGHHRYETALVYQAWLRQHYPTASAQATFNYTLMYLSNLMDPNLVILPAHRVLVTRRLPGFNESQLLARLPEFFDLQPLRPATESLAERGHQLATALATAGQTGTALGLVAPGNRVWLLKRKPGIMTGPLAAHIHPTLAQLDVVALNYLIFEQIMGVSPQDQDDEETFQYASTVTEALEAVATGRAGLAFLLNPTRIEQVQEVAAAGLTMPRKSTYFYPKILAGLVIHPIIAQEEVSY